jgi:integrase
VPELGAFKVRSVERGRVHQLLSEKAASGLHKKTARRILANLHSILEHAKHDDVIPANPLSGLAKFAGLTETRDEAQEAIKALTREELDRFLAAAAARRPAFWLLAFVGSRTGARLGEILGLRWSDFDWTARTVRLSRAVTPKGKPTTLKSKAARTVELGRVVTEHLQHHRAALEAGALAAGKEWTYDSPVFPNLGAVVATHASVNATFKRTLKAAGLPGHFSYHSLRHSFASILLIEGTPIQWVTQQLGHADIRTTFTIYGRWLKARADGASDALDSVPGQQGGNTEAEAAVAACPKSLVGVVRPARFERATYRFVVCRSIHLS